MSTLKTQITDIEPQAFVAGLPNARRADCEQLLSLMTRLSGAAATMWGPSIVGFGRYQYRYASGRSGDWMRIGFSPRKQNLTLYLMNGFDDYDALLSKLGPHSTGASCLYIKRLADVDLDVLTTMITQSLQAMRERHPDGA